MGGHLNACTSREQTVHYANVLRQDVPQAVDIIQDILQNAKPEEKKIEQEWDFILREQVEVDKRYEEVVFDHSHAAASISVDRVLNPYAYGLPVLATSGACLGVMLVDHLWNAREFFKTACAHCGSMVSERSHGKTCNSEYNDNPESAVEHAAHVGAV